MRKKNFLFGPKALMVETEAAEFQESYFRLLEIWFTCSANEWINAAGRASKRNINSCLIRFPALVVPTFSFFFSFFHLATHSTWFPFSHVFPSEIKGFLFPNLPPVKAIFMPFDTTHWVRIFQCNFHCLVEETTRVKSLNGATWLSENNRNEKKYLLNNELNDPWQEASWIVQLAMFDVPRSQSKDKRQSNY